jgi:hypothetical protein
VARPADRAVTKASAALAAAYASRDAVRTALFASTSVEETARLKTALAAAEDTVECAAEAAIAAQAAALPPAAAAPG